MRRSGCVKKDVVGWWLCARALVLALVDRAVDAALDMCVFLPRVNVCVVLRLGGFCFQTVYTRGPSRVGFEET